MLEDGVTLISPFPPLLPFVLMAGPSQGGVLEDATEAPRDGETNARERREAAAAADAAAGTGEGTSGKPEMRSHIVGCVVTCRLKKGGSRAVKGRHRRRMVKRRKRECGIVIVDDRCTERE